MANIQHRDIAAGEVHAPHNWKVANAAARSALTVAAGDVGKYCWQLDDNTEWMLTNHSPMTWLQRGAQGPTGPSGSGSGDMLKSENLSGLASYPTARANLGLVIGTDVQAYDVDTAKTDVAQNYTAPQRSAILTDNDANFDLSAKQNFKCTPTGAATLTFTNQVDGLSGSVLLINGGNYGISAHANTKISSAALTRISATGTYRVDYVSDGTNAYCTASENLA